MSRSERLYPERPILGCLAVVRRGSRILLAERSVPPGVGKWGFPGGAQELGETVHACARRELSEETGILAEPVAALTVLDVIRPDEAGRVKTHFALVCVLLDWREGEGEPIEDALRLGWFTLEEAARLDTFPDAIPVMRLALAFAG
ncbi:MAG TPA: NUDIX hydrolase [Stellaceae bacterium]|nr:NUDIX hydrolase [Stellaceae bacterium]